jgi:hypothetical protein
MSPVMTVYLLCVQMDLAHFVLSTFRLCDLEPHVFIETFVLLFLQKLDDENFR